MDLVVQAVVSKLTVSSAVEWLSPSAGVALSSAEVQLLAAVWSPSASLSSVVVSSSSAAVLSAVSSAGRLFSSQRPGSVCWSVGCRGVV